MAEPDIYLLIEENAGKMEFREYTKTYFPEIPFSAIDRFAKITVAPEQEFARYYANRTMILPLTGALDMSPETVLVPGEYRIFSQELITLKNVSEAHEAVFLVLEFSRPGEETCGIESIMPNRVPEGNMMPYFGLLTYREEKKTGIPPSGCFIHVLAGNFEVEDRYLHQGDTLVLLNVSEIEMECLSEKGLFLLFSA